jgi:hypothetical protein
MLEKAPLACLRHISLLSCGVSFRPRNVLGVSTYRGIKDIPEENRQMYWKHARGIPSRVGVRFRCFWLHVVCFLLFSCFVLCCLFFLILFFFVWLLFVKYCFVFYFIGFILRCVGLYCVVLCCVVLFCGVYFIYIF